MFRFLLVVGAVVLALAMVAVALPGQAAPAEAQAPSQLKPNPIQAYESILSGMNVTPTVNTMGNGKAILVADDDTNMVHYRVMVHEVMSITAITVNTGTLGTNGPELFSLFDAMTDTLHANEVLSGSFSITDEQVMDIASGEWYVNVATAEYPQGELRGQVSPAVMKTYNAVLAGQKEIPAVLTPASGIGTFQLSNDLTELQYELHLRDIMSVTMAHLHEGLPDETGGVRVPLYDASSGTPFGPDNPLAATVAISPTDVADLMIGNFYANVHTTQNPQGEIRGQVVDGYPILKAHLSSLQVVPPISSTVSAGQAVFVLDRDLSTVHYRVMVTGVVSETGVTINAGAGGTTGTEFLSLLPTTGPFDHMGTISGWFTTTLTQTADLVDEEWYLQVNTAANSGGELRGQIRPVIKPAHEEAKKEFHATLEQDVPPVAPSASSGEAHFWLSEMHDLLHYTITVSDVMSITHASLNSGWPNDMSSQSVSLYEPGDPRIFDPSNPLSGDVLIEPQDVLDLLTRHFIVDVRSIESPTSHLSGQVLPLIRFWLPTIFVNPHIID